jgi:pyruvate kinase
VYDLGSAAPTDLPRVACTIPDVVGQLALDAEVWFDDGQLGARVVELRDNGVLLTITHAPPKGKKLRSDKGLNLPGTDLAIVPLTAKDRADLAVVAQQADMDQDKKTAHLRALRSWETLFTESADTGRVVG